MRKSRVLRWTRSDQGFFIFDDAIMFALGGLALIFVVGGLIAGGLLLWSHFRTRPSAPPLVSRPYDDGALAQTARFPAEKDCVVPYLEPIRDGDIAIQSNWAFVGESVGDYGQVGVYQREHNEWKRVETLAPKTKQAKDDYGDSIACWGTTLVVSAKGRDTFEGAGRGAVFTYELSKTGEWGLKQVTKSKNMATNSFGIDVEIRADHLMASARSGDGKDAKGRVESFTRDRDGAWTEASSIAPGYASRDFGISIAMGYDSMLIGDPGSGCVGVYEPNGESWTLSTSLLVDYYGAESRFGQAVDIFGDTAVVGSPAAFASSGARRAGAITVFSRDASGHWKVLENCPGALQDEQLGTSVAVSGGLIGAGAPGIAPSLQAGVVRLWKNKPAEGDVEALSDLMPDRGSLKSGVPGFGTRLALFGPLLMVGEPGGVVGEKTVGGAYIYSPYTVPANQKLLIAAPNGIMANDDVVESPVTVEVVRQPDRGSVTMLADGTFEYTPGGVEAGVVTFQYRLRMARQASSAAVVTILVTEPVNGPATMGDDGLEFVQSEQATSGPSNFGAATAVAGDTAVVGAPGGGDSDGVVHVYNRSTSSGRWVRTATLRNPGDEATGSPVSFGCAVAIEGDSLVVGALGGDGVAEGSGCAWVFVRAGDRWVVQAKLEGLDGGRGDVFGKGVSISGNTVAVSAMPFVDGPRSSGSAYVFVRDGSAWTQQAQLSLPKGEEWASAFATGMSLRGDTLLLGLQRIGDPGRVLVYKRDDWRWRLDAQFTSGTGENDDGFGSSIAFDGHTAVVGAPRTEREGERTGAVYVAEEKAGRWTPSEVLVRGSDGGLGHDVSVWGDRALVSALTFAADGTSAEAWILDRAATGEWKVASGVWPVEGSRREFGSAIALSEGSALVSSMESSSAASGAVHFFRQYAIHAGRKLTTTRATGVLVDDWDIANGSMSAELASADGAGMSDASSCVMYADGSFAYTCDASETGPVDFTYRARSRLSGLTSPITDAHIVMKKNLLPNAADDTLLRTHSKLAADDPAIWEVAYGRAVARTDDLLAIAAGSINSTGSVYVYTKNAAGDWVSARHISAATSCTEFGDSLAIVNDLLFVGAPGEANGSGAVYVYDTGKASWWTCPTVVKRPLEGPYRFGDSVSAWPAAQGVTLLVGAPSDGLRSGEAYVCTGGDWSLKKRLLPTPGTGLEFGASVAITTDTAAVGAPGSGYVHSFFKTSTGEWDERLIFAPNSQTTRFGVSVGLHDDLLAVGAPYANRAETSMETTNAGTVHIFRRSGNQWRPLQEHQAIVPTNGDQFGVAVAVEGSDVLVGAPGSDDNAGAAYLIHTDAIGRSDRAVQRILSPDASRLASYGYALSLSENEAVVTAPFGEGWAPLVGAAYVQRQYQVRTGELLSVQSSEGVLANDCDLEGFPLRAAVVVSPANGTVRLEPDGSFNYTSDSGYSGVDSFTYYASNGVTSSSLRTVQINVEGSVPTGSPMQGDAPVVTIGVSKPAPDGLMNWYKTIPEITLAATGAAGNDARIFYRRTEDGRVGPWLQYNSPFPLSQGVTKVECYAIDVFQRMGSTASKSFAVDTIAPRLEAIAVRRTPGDRAVAIDTTSTDVGSGIAMTRFSRTGGTATKEWTVAGRTGFDSALVPGSTYQYSATPVDVAGNIGTPLTAASFMLDLTAPVTSPEINVQPSQTGWYRSRPNVTFTVNEQAVTWRQLDATTSAGWTCVSPAAAFQLPRGTHSLHFYSRDTQGNQEALRSLLFKVDDQAPTQVTAVCASPRKGSVLLTWNASKDPVSGVGEYRIQRIARGVISGVATIKGGSTQILDNPPAAGTYGYRIIARDVAGNDSLPTQWEYVRVRHTKSSPLTVLQSVLARLIESSQSAIQSYVSGLCTLYDWTYMAGDLSYSQSEVPKTPDATILELQEQSMREEFSGRPVVRDPAAAGSSTMPAATSKAEDQWETDGRCPSIYVPKPGDPAIAVLQDAIRIAAISLDEWTTMGRVEARWGSLSFLLRERLTYPAYKWVFALMLQMQRERVLAQYINGPLSTEMMRWLAR